MKRSFYSLTLLALMVNFLAGSWVGYQSGIKNTARAQDAFESQPPATEAEQSQSVSGHEAIHQIKPGESIIQVLKGMSVPEPLILEWKELARPLYDLSLVRPGQKLILNTATDGRIMQMVLEISPAKSSRLRISRSESGFEAELIKEAAQPSTQASITDAFPQRKYYAGSIETNFYQAGIDAGMEPELIMNLANIFSVQLNFSSTMKKGDDFEVLTEVLPSGDEKILAAKIIAGGKTYKAYYFGAGNAAGYFDEKARAWEGFQLLKPVRNGRISSTYTHRRYHPILGYYTPHLAVDYAAPQGTPVLAAASGVITFAGWRGGYGNYIELRHNSTYTTTYGHMRNFAPGIKTGKRVKRGQVIGYVGMTGLATGPHLDYRIFKNGGSINPLRFKGDRVKRVQNPAKFHNTRLAIEIEMQVLKQPLEIPNEKLMLAAVPPESL